jgi:hypothetical protein
MEAVLAIGVNAILRRAMLSGLRLAATSAETAAGFADLYETEAEEVSR